MILSGKAIPQLDLQSPQQSLYKTGTQEPVFWSTENRASVDILLKWGILILLHDFVNEVKTVNKSLLVTRVTCQLRIVSL